MELMFLGADHEVTGSCHYLQVGKKKFLVDCGMEQGIDRFENADMPVPASEIDFVFLTHAHIDHSGMLPKLYRDGFRGQIISTRATASLCNIMLKDSAHIQEMEAQWRNKKAKRKIDGEGYEPIYTMEDAVETIKLFVEYPYGKIFTVCDGIRFRFTDVGHLLGSASIELWLTEGNTEKKIVFSGDIGNKMQPLLKDPEYTAEADYVVMESTYGDRIHEKDDEDVVQDLADIISETFHRGGNVVIPAFAIGRTQVMLYYIRHIKEKNMVPDFPNFPVYVDSPLAVEATQIFYECGQECYDDEALDLLAKDINPIGFPNLNLSITTDDSKAINFIEEPKVIISASGMCDAGRIKHHLKYNLWREDSTILMVGYQSEGSPGRKIQDGAKEIKIFGEDVAVRAKIQTLPGLSGHADRLGLLEWIEAFKYKPRQVFVVHGEDQVAELFSKTLSEECGIRSAAPYSGTRYDLAAGKFILITSGIPISKATAGRMVSSSFTKLKFTGRRILDFINGCQGLPNKDLERFSQDLEALIEKYRVDQKKSAVDRNWAIGNKGQLLVRIPGDHRMFRQETLDKVIVYGRKTLETFPMAQPLDRRINIVLSTNPSYKVKNATVVHSIEELLGELRSYPSEDVYIIGGESIYRQMLPYCDTAHITKIDYAYEADAYFPNLDEDPDWEVTADSDEQTYFDIAYTFVRYERKK